MNSLAREVTSAQKFTGKAMHEPGQRLVCEPVCALAENQGPLGQLTPPAAYRFEGTEFLGSHHDVYRGAHGTVSGPMTLASGGADPDASTSADKFRLAAIDIRYRLANFKNRLPSDTFNLIVHRLTVLLDPEEWQEGDAIPQIDSFQLMLQFLAANKSLRPPRLVLSRQGLFVISWREARDQLVSLEFQPGGSVGWLVFAPPPSGRKIKERAAGDTSADACLSRVAKFGALRWIIRDPKTNTR